MLRSKSNRPRRGTQDGVILLVSLIILLLVTILGFAVLNITTMEEKMAAGTRDKDLAFQAAEAALKIAEQRIVSQINGTAGFTQECNQGLCSALPLGAAVMRWNNPDYCGTGLDIWSCNKSFEVTGADALDRQVYRKMPKYIIESLTQIESAESIMMGNIGDAPTDQKIYIYRITVVGFGGSNDSRVVLQSTYGKAI